jgi:hypothetical protein
LGLRNDVQHPPLVFIPEELAKQLSQLK